MPDGAKCRTAPNARRRRMPNIAKGGTAQKAATVAGATMVYEGVAEEIFTAKDAKDAKGPPDHSSPYVADAPDAALLL